MKYLPNKSGSTTGSVSGVQIQYKKGVIVDVEDGDLDHTGFEVIEHDIPEDVELNDEQLDQLEGTTLPDDFPALDILLEAGYSTFEEVDQASDEELIELDGIGEKTLGAIRLRLEE